jgi:hypothetical protein
MGLQPGEARFRRTTLKQPDIGVVDDLNYMTFAAGPQYRL